MARKKQRLQVEQEYDFSLIGIFSPISDYRLSWCLNQSLGFKLRRSDDILHFNEVSLIKVPYAVFDFFYPEWDRHFFLIPNRKAGNIILRSPRNLDYMLVTHPACDSDTLSGLINKIRNIELIHASYHLDTSKIKNIDV
ncbi:MAG: IPExxxVDY family protein, partial [Clostridiaceae bacterium]|nr:IPExxxVDY family protein [Clostridiaceae bacterium]